MATRTAARAKFPREIDFEPDTLGRSGAPIALVVAVCLGGGALTLGLSYGLRAKSQPADADQFVRKETIRTTAIASMAAAPAPAANPSEDNTSQTAPAANPSEDSTSQTAPVAPSAPRTAAQINPSSEATTRVAAAASASAAPKRARPPGATTSSNPAFPRVTSAPLRDFESPQRSRSIPASDRSDDLHVPGGNNSGSSFNPALPDNRATTSPNPALPNAGSASGSSNPALPNNSGFSFPSMP
ncbi:MAG TPA: hypothetical protein VHV51_18325 [Polyangiaceae bacterium]|nr:hypothetical protein [Polyangiaceae bacterium]